MGQFEAGKWIVFIFVYFILLIFIVDAAENTQTVLDVEISGSDYSQWAITSYCQNPRYKYDSTDLTIKEYNKGQIDSLYCSESYGVQSQASCENIEGCEWDNQTTTYWFFWEVTGNETCIGNINATYYGVEDQQRNIQGDRQVSLHDSADAWEVYKFKSASPCDHPNVILNKTRCEAFSCTWEEVDYSKKFTNPSSILKTMGTVFTFQYDFGFSNDLGLIKALLNILLILLPLIILGIAIYFSLPIIH